MPMATAPTPSSSDDRAPHTRRLRRSRPSRCPSVPGPWRASDPSVAFGSSSGRTGASTAAATTNTSQAMATLPGTPSRPDRRTRAGATSAAPPRAAASAGARTTAGAPPAATSTLPAGSPSAERPDALPVPAATSGSGMADPRVEDGVEHVHQEVDEDIAHRDDRDQALEGDVLPGVDGLAQQQPHAG